MHIFLNKKNVANLITQFYLYICSRANHMVMVLGNPFVWFFLGKIIFHNLSISLFNAVICVGFSHHGIDSLSSSHPYTVWDVYCPCSDQLQVVMPMRQDRCLLKHYQKIYNHTKSFVMFLHSLLQCPLNFKEGYVLQKYLLRLGSTALNLYWM